MMIVDINDFNCAFIDKNENSAILSIEALESLRAFHQIGEFIYMQQEN